MAYYMIAASTALRTYHMQPRDIYPNLPSRAINMNPLTCSLTLLQRITEIRGSSALQDVVYTCGKTRFKTGQAKIKLRYLYWTMCSFLIICNFSGL